MFDVMLGDVLSARTNDDNDKMLKLSLSSPNFAKPPVVSRLLTRLTILNLKTIGNYSNVGILISSDFLFEE
jgi:hypothetical protein